ncbi:hypothetical protein F441_19305 [Phytophthora nicotianae CJ01A1]|uniref:Uncharacterized protein n=5 Tax=Phytophthora nicotianae TaxID=4792 RepID=V9E6K3_PHYNI|nr:hypothetical protein F443_19482 [Phytophthora nicotianae P1569]ETK74253.1 hypothetical protein L915_18901 [Phytophthora nicotianae]ETP03776.1 hypothetical protein F441_19305 [Phytophthora nicotianae CJ01A1]ETP31929.1 hypothetical protein F442_19253 [Phytophthora nicotianae P10297]ETL27682.1 hypothetical protein L916_18799 [Phytophthora nicotianae]
MELPACIARNHDLHSSKRPLMDYRAGQAQKYFAREAKQDEDRTPPGPFTMGSKFAI